VRSQKARQGFILYRFFALREALNFTATRLSFS
jgi:hypothetical protein